MNEQIKLKIGDFEFEGNASFLMEGLPAALDAVLPRLQASRSMAPNREDSAAPSPLKFTGAKANGTVQSVAAKMSVKSGPELIKAALTHAILIKGKDSLHRRELLGNMQAATAYYKGSFGKHYGEYLADLIKRGEINEVAKDTFSLPSATRESMERLLSA